MFNVKRRIFSSALALALTVTTVFGNSSITFVRATASEKNVSEDEVEVVTDAEQVNANSAGLCDNTKDGVILHAFCWSFNTIKANMKDIAEAGYTTVQTSPANECLVGEGGGMDILGNGKWYYHYQPTDWKIGNYQLGSRDDFKAMCAEADKYGIKIIVDVLPNHTTPSLGSVAQELNSAAGGDLYHANGFKGIQDSGEWCWSNRLACTTGQMGGLPDVNTENKGFQEYYLKYCNDVIGCGGDGFRYDTAKHIGVPSDPKDPKSQENDFWPVVTGKKAVNGVSLTTPDKLFIYGEVLQDNGIPYEEYASYMEMTASGYGDTLRGAVGSSDFGTGRISNWNHSTPNKIVTWVESHDTYYNNHDSAWLTDWNIRAAWAIIAARDKGTPLFFSRPMNSNGSAGNIVGNNKMGEAGNDQYKHPEVAAVNFFRNAMVGESENLSNPTGSNSLLVIERGTKGAVVINLGSTASNIKMSKLADGAYTEQVSGKQVNVSGGVLDYSVEGGTIAVIYNAGPIVKTPTVNVSKDSGTFSAAFDLTLTPANATSATYSVNGGEAVSITSKTTVKIGEGASVGDKITVKVTATGEGDPFEKTYTYTMVEVPEASFLIRIKKSDFKSAPSVYVYADKTAITATFPGDKMSEDGDYWVYTNDKIETGSAIFTSNDGDAWRDPADQQPGHAVTGMMEYDKSTKKLSPITIPTKTKEPVKTTEPVKTAEPTKAPTTAPVKTEEPAADMTIKSSLEDGASFKTEAEEITLTLVNATSGTYSVDNGPEKTFTKSTKVTIGQGKIADTDITVKVTATDGSNKTSKTFTYKKVFDKTAANNVKKTSVVEVLQDIFEVIENATQVNALSPAVAEGIYSTNGTGVGKKATISIDGSFTDWSEDMLIAQGAAFDSPTAFKGTHENWVMDSYSLYGAWDDENLYVAWQLVNVYDTFWHQEGDGPLMENGKPVSAPIFIALNTGKGNAMTGEMTGTSDAGIWNVNTRYETPVDNIIAIHANASGVPGLFKGDSTGASNYKDLCLDFKSTGIEFDFSDGCFPEKIQGVKGPASTDELYSTASNWIDYKTVADMTRPHNTDFDTFYEMKIPFSALGVTKEDVEKNGIGVMQLISRGESAMDCVPHDKCMLDNVMEDYGGASDNTSHEKDDVDIITVPLAKVGAQGDTPIVTSRPVTTTPAPEKTEEPIVSKAPTKTEEPTVSIAPTKTEEPTEGNLTVNFGADRSSPQLDTTKLTLKAIGYNGTEPYTYEFSVDGEVVQKDSKTATYAWSPTAGTHKIKVVMKDKDGTAVSSEKEYVIETEGGETPKPIVTTAPTKLPAVPETPKPTPKVTKEPQETMKPQETKSPEEDNELKITLKTSKASPQILGTKVTLKLSATGGTAPYTYTVSVTKGSGKAASKTYKNRTGAVSTTWTASKTGTYTIQAKVVDAKGDIQYTTKTYKIKAKQLKINKFSLSKSTIKVKKKVTISAKATAEKGSVQYKISVLAPNSKKKTTLKKFSTKSSTTWTPKKAGKYTLYLTIKDKSGKEITRTKKVTVTKK